MGRSASRQLQLQNFSESAIKFIAYNLYGWAITIEAGARNALVGRKSFSARKIICKILTGCLFGPWNVYGRHGLDTLRLACVRVRVDRDVPACQRAHQTMKRSCFAMYYDMFLQRSNKKIMVMRLGLSEGDENRSSMLNVDGKIIINGREMFPFQEKWME